MSIEIARYQFHPWSRKGISTGISEIDDLGGGVSLNKERAEVPVPLKLNEVALNKNFALIGPGDIVGVKRDMIIRHEPLNWITDFEANYLAFIEFYDEDFVWRYTPASPSGDKLRPWLQLLVLKEDEFERTDRKIPLPVIQNIHKDAFPPAAETWMWAHVHSNADIPDSELNDYEKFLLSLNTVVNDDPDQVYCRLMSPRKLEPNTAYCAFLVPAFETGRLAGLEQPTEDIIAQLPSWDANGARGEMPVYFEWFFRTGQNMDFEALVKALEPIALDPRVGIRDMDCSRPGFVQRDNAMAEIPGTDPQIIGLEGALKSPATVSTVFPKPSGDHGFQTELQKIVNLQFEVIGEDTSGDPIISVPLYGANHAKRKKDNVVKLDVSSEWWVQDLNRDPRTRVPAGFGTLVVQKNQENYMRKAWEDVDAVIEANKKLKLAQFHMNIAQKHALKSFQPLAQNVLLGISKPLMPKVMGSPTTLHYQLEESTLPTAMYSSAFRSLMRPKGRLVQRLGGSKAVDYPKLVDAVNQGRISAGKPKVAPAGIPTVDQFATQIAPKAIPKWLAWFMKNALWFLLGLMVLLIILALIFKLYPVFAGIAIVALFGFLLVAKRNKDRKSATSASETLADPEKALQGFASIPQQPKFTLVLSDEASTPPSTATSAGKDSVEGANYRLALGDFLKRVAPKQPEIKRVSFNVANAYQKMANAINPQVSFPLYLKSFLLFPAYLDIFKPDKLYPAMQYPDFEEPMYKKLLDISEEFLLPNLKLIPNNCISLLKTNQKFIESYMVGLNHEMGRELLWREYPTDQRGSYFRQFWDVSGLIKAPEPSKTAAQIAEESKDIRPIHLWDWNEKLTKYFDTKLGRHNNRDAEGDAEQTVLVIRGDLLRRYPRTVIFAQKALAGTGDGHREIDLDLTAAEFETMVKFPLYRAEINPDIKLFGFDLTIDQCKGTAPSPGFPGDTFGWFFVIQEVPGEPRFGMDITFDEGSDGLSWDDLAWTQLPSNTQFITKTAVPTIGLPAPEKAKWASDSANMASILLQKPVMVAVHAKEMLENLNDTRMPFGGMFTPLVLGGGAVPIVVSGGGSPTPPGNG